MRADVTAEAEQRWAEHVKAMYSMMLMRKAKSWFTGYNSNVPGHEQGTIRYFVYNAGTPKYVAKITDVEMNNYKEIDFAAGMRTPCRRERRRLSARERAKRPQVTRCRCR